MDDHQINLFLQETEFRKLINGGIVAGSIRLREGSEQIADLRAYVRSHGESKTTTTKTEHGKVVVGPLRSRFSFSIDSSLPTNEIIERLREECDEAIEFLEKNSSDE